jgi:hypothetical protein
MPSFLRTSPSWLLGALVAVFYGLLTMLLEFGPWACNFRAQDMCGLVTVILNAPSAYLATRVIDTFGWQFAPAPVGLLLILLFNFLLGALLGHIILHWGFGRKN